MDENKSQKQLITESRTPADNLCRSQTLADEMIRENEETACPGDRLKYDYTTWLCVIDTDYNIIQTNKPFETLLKSDKHEIAGGKCYQLLKSPMCHTPDCPLARIKAGEERAQHEIERYGKNGSKILCTATAIRNKDGSLIGILEDSAEFTESRQSEETLNRLENELQRSEKLFAKIFYNSLIPTTISRVSDGRITKANNAFLQLTEYKREEIIGKHLFNLGLWIEPYGDEKMIASLRIKKFAYNKEINIRRKSGEIRNCLYSSMFVEFMGESHILSLAMDITDRIKAEEKLRRRIVIEEALARTSRLIALSPDPDFNLILKILGEAVDANRAYICRLQDNEDQIKNTHQWFDPGTTVHTNSFQNIRLSEYPWLKKKIETKKNIIMSDIELLPPEAQPEKTLCRDRNIKSLFAVPIVSNENHVIGLMGFEITEECREWSVEDAKTLGVASEMISTYYARKKAEEDARQKQEQLTKADRMISLGTLVTGVAHEINNPNHFILSNAQTLIKVWHDLEPILEGYYRENSDFIIAGINYSEIRADIPALLSGILDGAGRIKHIVRELRDFAHNRPVDCSEIVDINSMVESATRLISKTIKQSTENFTLNFSEGLSPIKGNARRLEQVIINLIQNACQAINDVEKKILVSTFYNKNEDALAVEVRDEGEGIPEENLKHIVDPFYTTRRDTGGTGLGLSISSTIVREHGGTLSFESTPGNGTAATLLLPLHCKQDSQVKGNK